MMTEHLTDQLVELYQRRQIDPAERQKSDAHLAVCQACLNRVLDPEHAVLVLHSLSEAFLPSLDEEPFHLSHAELKNYVGGAAAKADRIICESHIEICDQCKEELRLLSTSPAAQKSQSKALPLTARFAWFRPAWKSFTPARVAVAIALLGLLALAVVQWRRQQSFVSTKDTAGNGSRETPTAAPPPATGATSKPAAGQDASNESMVVSLKDNGREIRLDQEGKLTGLEYLDEPAQKIVKEVLAGERLAKPKALDELSSPRIKLLGDAPNGIALRLISPLGKIITEERPTLRWRELNGATSYVVSVFDQNFNLIAKSPPLSKPEWTLAAPLQRGRSYSWEVTALKEGKGITAPVAPAPRAQFKVLEADQLSALTRLKQQQPVSHLALGLMYARCGLVSDARAEFRQLVKANPDSEIATKLLRAVQAWQGR